MSEAEWLKTHSGTLNIKIKIPNDPTHSNWKFNGQTAAVNLEGTATIKQLKQSLSGLLGGMPANKQQLKHPQYGFMKDGKTIAHYNLDGNCLVDLVPRKRGRR